MTKESKHTKMKWQLLNSQSDKIRFTLISTFFAFILGIYWYTIPIAAENMYFFISAPIATFICSSFGWTWMMKSKKSYTLGNVSALSIIITIVAIFINWEVLAIGRRLTGDHIDYHGVSESIYETFIVTPLFNTYLSLFYVGWVGLILFIMVGMYVIKTSKNKK